MIARKQNTTPGVRKLVRRFAVEGDDVGETSDVSYLNTDIEEKYAMEYLAANFPLVDRNTLLENTPRGIDRRLYGYGGFYQNGKHDFVDGAYPESLIDEATPDQPPAANADSQPLGDDPMAVEEGEDYVPLEMHYATQPELYPVGAEPEKRSLYGAASASKRAKHVEAVVGELAVDVADFI